MPYSRQQMVKSDVSDRGCRNVARAIAAVASTIIVSCQVLNERKRAVCAHDHDGLQDEYDVRNKQNAQDKTCQPLLNGAQNERGTYYKSGAQDKSGAQERTRTSTPLQAPAPEAGASTNSATWALMRGHGDTLNQCAPSMPIFLSPEAVQRPLPVQTVSRKNWGKSHRIFFTRIVFSPFWSKNTFFNKIPLLKISFLGTRP
jgi:hypothetical protein